MLCQVVWYLRVDTGLANRRGLGLLCFVDVREAPAAARGPKGVQGEITQSYAESDVFGI